MEEILWILTVIAIIGAVLNAKKRIEGFFFWIISNAGLVIVNFNRGDKAQSFLFFFYFCLCLYGLYKWRKEE